MRAFLRSTEFVEARVQWYIKQYVKYSLQEGNPPDFERFCPMAFTDNLLI